MGYVPAMHTVGVLALDGVIGFDLSTPVEVFGRANRPDGRPAYRIRVAGDGDINAGAFTLRAPWQIEDLVDADTIMVPGRADPTAPTPSAALEALRTAAAKGTRIASICSGAFTLAEA